MSMDQVPTIFKFWGKARPLGTDSLVHPLPFHLLDVAATVSAILDGRSIARGRAAGILGLSETDALALIQLIAALHDVGKFAAAFQAKAVEHFPRGVFGCDALDVGARSEHDADGRALWEEKLADQFVDRFWPQRRGALGILMAASVAHHGRPVAQTLGGRAVEDVFRREGVSAAQETAHCIADLILPAPILSGGADEDRLREASFWLSGLLTVADWIGSSQNWFPYTSPEEISLKDYWATAQMRAHTAVRSAGVVAARAAGRRPLVEVAWIPAQAAATPLQAKAAEIPLPDGPLLILIEDVTGAGKTEAAQMFIHRLMADGRASGAYWGMPTQATANAMYKRQASMLPALYAPDARPSLVLAHGQARLYGAFSAPPLASAGVEESDDSQENASLGNASDESASAACAAFLADDRRAALLADIGAGTIDQALLAALPSRHHTVRLFGLAEKVLLIDEAHAYDSYMGAEVEGLLRFQAALGGSAIVLSATLPRADRERFVRAWREGLGDRTRGTMTAKQDYPLLTMVSGAGVTETSVDAAPWSHRTTPVRFVDSAEAVVGALEDAVRKGAAAAWVRNSVDDAIGAAEMLRARGLIPLLFHARFAQGDRQRIEAEVMRVFGKTANAEERRGQVIVATQVIEQSLDLDFDAMASDLAPIDLLIQRAGRLRRHRERDGTRPSVSDELLVLSPAFTETPGSDWLSSFAPVSEWIYQDPAILWRTRKGLGAVGEIVAPDAFRDLIESVYARDAETPPGLQKKADGATGQQGAERSLGQMAVVSLRQGYLGEGRAIVDDGRALTRLGEEQTVLRLAKIIEGGALAPFIAHEHKDVRLAWALSEVRVSSFRAPRGAAPAPEFRAAAALARAQWGRRERERDDLIVLPLEPTSDGFSARLYAGASMHNYRYSNVSGLTFW